MKNTITSILLFVLMLQLASCKKDKVESSRKSKAVSQQNAAMQEANDTVFDRKNIFYPFIKKNHPKVLNDKMLFFKENDLDLDGKMEAVIAFGNDSDAGPFIENLFVLKNDQGIIKEIKANFDFKKHSISDIDLISLKGKNKSYISLEIFEGPYAYGFAIYEMINNQIKQIFTSPSVDKNKSDFFDVLTDSNKDGQFDGYSQKVTYERFTIESQFTYENDTFKFKKRYYVMDEYPEQIKPVIAQYICIKSLGFADDVSNKRLQELCLDKTVEALPFNVENWKAAYLKISNYDDDGLNINENDNLGIAEANLNFTDPKKNINYQLKFELQQTNNKWQITKIEVNEE